MAQKENNGEWTRMRWQGTDSACLAHWVQSQHANGSLDPAGGIPECRGKPALSAPLSPCSTATFHFFLYGSMISPPSDARSPPGECGRLGMEPIGGYGQAGGNSAMGRVSVGAYHMPAPSCVSTEKKSHCWVQVCTMTPPPSLGLAEPPSSSGPTFLHHLMLRHQMLLYLDV